MKFIFSIGQGVFALLITVLISAPVARAVTLDSTGTNNEYVGVANYAFSYAPVPYVLEGNCSTQGSEENNSFWQPIPEFCDTSTTSSCWADTCTNCAISETSPVAEAAISMTSMRKGLLWYYADNHADESQGYCNFSIGPWLFSINFGYENTGEDFSLSLYAEAYVDGVLTIVNNSDGWTTSGACPQISEATTEDTGFSLLPTPLTANTDPSSQYNLICNEDFAVSLAADPDTSNAAMISVVNRLPGLVSGAVELSTETTVVSDQAAAQQSSEVGLRRLDGRSSDSASESLSSQTTLRRFSNRTDTTGRWLITSDGDGQEFRGVLVSGSGPAETERVACQLIADDGNPRPVERNYEYECDLSTLDGTSARNEVISMPGTVLRVRPRAGSLPEFRRTDADVVSHADVAIKAFAKGARVGAADGSKNLVWHGQTDQSQVVMVKDDSTGDIEVVTHSPKALSPVFMSCAAESQLDTLNPQYLCKANLRCTGSPCQDASWSVRSRLTLPTALFKNRPCQPDNGVPAQDSLLKASSLVASGSSGQLIFEAGMVLPAGSAVRPDQNGFRILVEDADGNTVVDLDVPGDTPGQSQQGSWQVAQDLTKFTYGLSDASPGARLGITIEKKDGAGNDWRVTVSGITNGLSDGNLKRPLAASFTLNPSDENSALCATTYGGIKEPALTTRLINRNTALLQWTPPEMGGHTFAGYTVTWGLEGSSIPAGTIFISDINTLSTVITDLDCGANCSFEVSTDSISVSALAPPASRIPAVGVQSLIFLTLFMLGIGLVGIRRFV